MYISNWEYGNNQWINWLTSISAQHLIYVVGAIIQPHRPLALTYYAW